MCPTAYQIEGVTATNCVSRRKAETRECRGALITAMVAVFGIPTLTSRSPGCRMDNPPELFAHEVAPPKILATLFEVLRNPIVRVVFEITSIRVAGSSLLQLADDIAGVEMVENPHELTKVDIRDALVAANHKH